MTRTPRIFVNERGAVRAPVASSISYYEQDPRWTEVKLAPLDAIVIDRAEVPGTIEGGGYVAAALVVRGLDADPAQVRRVGLANLAIAEYLDAPPPVDEAQVQAVKEALLAARVTGSRYDEAVTADARRLVQRGVRVEVTE
jgi:hypothetical protein